MRNLIAMSLALSLCCPQSIPVLIVIGVCLFNKAKLN